MDRVSPERWREIERLLDTAIDLPAESRAEFIRQAAGDDTDLALQVERLFAAMDEPDTRLDAGAGGLAADLLARAHDLTPPSNPPVRIHRYLILDEIGRGGMGVVYQAEDPDLGRTVALKLVRGGFDLDERLLRRFHDERMILAALDHPHIARLLDGGLTDDGLPFFVMERVEGVPIDRYCDDRRLRIEERLALFEQVCEAVEHAHTRGIVHRDLKPPNIQVTRDGWVKLLDFGIAKLLVSDTADDRTRTGHHLMTPEYASPEQVRGEPVSPASDVYSLGVLLYQLLTGRRPYRVTSRRQHDLQRAVLEQEPTRPSSALLRRRQPGDPGDEEEPTAAAVAEVRALTPDRLRRRLLGDLDAIVLKALEKRPGQRYATAGEMAADVRRHLAGLPVTAQHDSRGYRARKFVRRNRLQVAGAASVVLLLAITSVATAVWMRRSVRSDGLVPVGLGRATKLTFDPGLELDPAVSPDGRVIAYATGRQSATRIQLHALENDQRTFLTSAAAGQARNPRWSPDGRRVAYQAANSLWEVAVEGGDPRLLVAGEAGAPAAWLAWAPDGQRIAYLRDGAMWIRELADGATRQIADSPEAYGLAWSPDGRWIAFAAGNSAFVVGVEQLSGSVGVGNIAPSSIWIVPAAGGPPRRLTGDDDLDVSPTWMPDSRSLLYVSDSGGGRDVYFLRIDEQGQARGAPRRLTTGLQAHTIGVSSDGRLLVYSTFTPTSNVYSVVIPGGEAVSSRNSDPVTDGSRIVEGLSVSPDGRWLAFDSNHLGNQDIFKMELAVGEPVRLTSRPSDDFEPAWGPDGREIAYHSFAGGVRQIRLVAADGTDDRAAFPVEGHHQNFPQWSPDRRRLTYHSWDTGEPHLFLLTRSADGEWTAPERLVEQPGEMARWSPDGRRIAFVFRTSLWTLDIETRATRELFASNDPVDEPVPVMPVWSRTGDRIYYKAFDAQGRASIWSIAAEGGPPALLVRFDDPLRQSSRPELATDGERFYFTVGSLESDVWTLELMGVTGGS